MRKRKQALKWSVLTILMLAASVVATAEHAPAQSGRYLFLTGDVNQPVPGTDYTAEEFTELGIDLFDSWAALEAAITDDVCWVGVLAVSDPEVELWLRNPNNTAKIVTYRVDESLSSDIRFLNYGLGSSHWGIRDLASALQQYSCEQIEKRVAQALAEQTELEALFAMQAPEPTGHGGVFMAMDLAEPIPGAPYTADDFAAANIRLLPPNDALFPALTDDICMVGGLPEPLGSQLFAGKELVERLIEINYN